MRSPSLLRQWGKFALFLARGHSPRVASWLALHDAPRQGDYRGIALAALAQAHATSPDWTDVEARGGRLTSGGPKKLDKAGRVTQKGKSI